MKIKYLGLSLILAILNSACATGFYKDATGGIVGCDPDDVSIGKVKSGFRTQSWSASCKGQRFICSSISSSGMGSNQVSCNKAL